MRQRFHLVSGVLAAVFVMALAASAAAQTGRVGGVVKDEAGMADLLGIRILVVRDARTHLAPCDGHPQLVADR